MNSGNKDIRVKIGLRNNHLISLREALDLTQMALAKIMEIGVGLICEFECMKRSPFLKDGSIHPVAQKYLDFFGVCLDDLWPGDLAEIILTKPSREFNIDCQEIYCLSGFDDRGPDQHLLQREASGGIELALDSLEPREARVLRMRFYEEMTLAEIGEKLEVSKSRIGQIETKALQKLRHPSRARKIRIFHEE